MPRTNSTLALLLLVGCVGPTTPEAAPPSGVAAPDPDGAWRRVLATWIDEQGRVDWQRRRQPEDLLTFVQHVAHTAAGNAPELFADRARALAFHCNAYVALVLYGRVVLQHDLLGPHDGNRFEIGGQRLTLREYEDQLIRPLGDRRAFFALRSPFWRGPALRREPFTAANVDRMLDDLAREAIAKRESIAVHASGQRVRLSKLMSEFAARWCEAPGDVLEFADRYRPVPLPQGCTIEPWRDPDDFFSLH